MNIEKQCLSKIQVDSKISSFDNWFLYWKISQSLWEDKLKDYKYGDILFIPINWGHHYLDDNKYDFGLIRPETDILKLCRLCHDKGLKIYLLFPLGPMPLMINGGLPSHLSTSMAMDNYGSVYTLIGHEQSDNHIYSFYNPKIFSALQKFLQVLSLNLQADKALNEKIYILDSFYNTGVGLKDYFEDTSRCFQSAFEKYCRNKKIDQDMTGVEKVKFLEDLSVEFRCQIKGMYQLLIEEMLAENYGKVLSFCFLGLRPSDYIAQKIEVTKSLDYFDTAIEGLSSGHLPSMALLEKSPRNSSVSEFLSSVLSKTHMESLITGEDLTDESDYSFSPLISADLIVDNYHEAALLKGQETGLLNTLQIQFPNSYRFLLKKDMSQFLENEKFGENLFYLSDTLSDSDLTCILKLFLLGKKIFLDKRGLTQDLRYRLNRFFLENSIKTYKLQNEVEIEVASFGESLIFIVNTESLLELTLKSKKNFWNKVLTLFQLVNVELAFDQDLRVFWLSRLPLYGELNFEEIRQLAIVNLTNYKRRGKIFLTPHFHILKGSEVKSASFKVSKIGIDVEVEPFGRAKFLFGKFGVEY